MLTYGRPPIAISRSAIVAGERTTVIGCTVAGNWCWGGGGSFTETPAEQVAPPPMPSFGASQQEVLELGPSPRGSDIHHSLDKQSGFLWNAAPLIGMFFQPSAADS